MTRRFARSTVLSLAALTFAFSFAAFAADAWTPPAELTDVGNKTCPVMAGKAVTETGGVAIFEGKLYHFCCNGCPIAFAKDPKKFAAAAKGEESKLTVDPSGKDPVNGKPASDKFVRVLNGKVYFFADADSLKAWDKEPSKYEKAEAK